MAARRAATDRSCCILARSASDIIERCRRVRDKVAVTHVAIDNIPVPRNSFSWQAGRVAIRCGRASRSMLPVLRQTTAAGSGGRALKLFNLNVDVRIAARIRSVLLTTPTRHFNVSPCASLLTRNQNGRPLFDSYGLPKPRCAGTTACVIQSGSSAGRDRAQCSLCALVRACRCRRRLCRHLSVLF
jgi:hypothetical protein